jgi:hypothetical protein
MRSDGSRELDPRKAQMLMFLASNACHWHAFPLMP